VVSLSNVTILILPAEYRIGRDRLIEVLLRLGVKERYGSLGIRVLGLFGIKSANDTQGAAL